MLTLWRIAIRDLGRNKRRSALTLIVRMYQLVCKSRATRVLWQSGFRSFINKLLMCCMSKNLHGVKVEHLGHDILTQFAPIVPKERSAIVEEVVQLAGVDRISPERSVEILGNVDNEEEEVQRIKDFIDWQLKTEKKHAPQPAMAPGRPQAGPTRS